MDSPKRQLKQGTNITIPRGGRAGTADPATADLPEFKHKKELRRS